MPRGRRFPMERIDRTDTTSGALVRQITRGLTMSMHMHYETTTFTPDGERMVFASG